MSSAIESKTSNTTGIAATISLWYCTDASLPSVAAGTNNSIVATLNANGLPATVNGTWVQVPGNSLGAAQFIVTPNATTNFNLNGFSGWDMQGASATQTANFFAIVVGFGAMNSGDTISINSVSIVPGDIPTRPAPQGEATVLNECRTYYNMSFNLGVVPAQNVGLGKGEFASICPAIEVTQPFYPFILVFLQTNMRVAPTVTTYSPLYADSNFYNLVTSAPLPSTSTSYVSQNSFTLGRTAAGSGTTGDLTVINWTADARLGIV